MEGRFAPAHSWHTVPDTVKGMRDELGIYRYTE